MCDCENPCDYGWAVVLRHALREYFPDCRINDMRPKVASLKSNVRKMKNANPDLTLDQICESVHKKFKSKLAK